jgi:hypothetical protein
MTTSAAPKPAKPTLATCDTLGEKVFHIAALVAIAAPSVITLALAFLGFFR